MRKSRASELACNHLFFRPASCRARRFRRTELLTRHIVVTALRHSIHAPAKTGANRGHGVPVTPDERAPLIRGRIFAKLVTKSCCKPFRPVIISQSCPKLLSRTMKARFSRAFIFSGEAFARRLGCVPPVLDAEGGALRTAAASRHRTPTPPCAGRRVDEEHTTRRLRTCADQFRLRPREQIDGVPCHRGQSGIDRRIGEIFRPPAPEIEPYLSQRQSRELVDHGDGPSIGRLSFADLGSGFKDRFAQPLGIIQFRRCDGSELGDGIGLE
jgi:hypothetical protein